MIADQNLQHNSPPVHSTASFAFVFTSLYYQFNGGYYISFFLLLFFIYCGFPLLLESSASLSILRLSYTEAAVAAAILRYLCIFIRCVTSMKSVWSFTFHNDSGVWRTQESEKSHSFLFLPLVRYSNMVYSTIFSLSSSTSLLGCNSNDFHQKPPLPQFDCWASDMLTMRWTSINK